MGTEWRGETVKLSGQRLPAGAAGAVEGPAHTLCWGQRSCEMEPGSRALHHLASGYPSHPTLQDKMHLEFPEACFVPMALIVTYKQSYVHKA